MSENLKDEILEIKRENKRLQDSLNTQKELNEVMFKLLKKASNGQRLSYIDTVKIEGLNSKI